MTLNMNRSITLVALLSALARAQYTATYTPQDAPATSEDGQSGTNQCGTGNSATSECQNLYVNGLDDFCLWAPPSGTTQYGDSSIGNSERIVVSYCLQGNYGTRLIPQGAISGANMIVTPNYVEILGTLSTAANSGMNIVAGDAGGELDPHGADGLGNPIGGLVFSNLFGGTQQIHEWTEFIGDGYFCIRICPDGPDAASYCNHIYDELGCSWNMPGNYDGFSVCDGDSGEPMGVYSGSTFYQGAASTPDAHAAPATSNCTPYSSLSAAAGAVVTSGTTSASSSTTQAVTTTSATSSGQTSRSNSSSASSTVSSTSMTSSSTSTGTSSSSSAPSTTSTKMSSTAGSSTGSATRSGAESALTAGGAATSSSGSMLSVSQAFASDSFVWPLMSLFVAVVGGGAVLL